MTEAARVESGPASPEGAGVCPARRTGAAASPHVHTRHSAPARRRRRCRQPDPPPRCDLSPRPLCAPARRPPPRSRITGLRAPFPLRFSTSIFLLGCAVWRHLPPPIPYDTICGAGPIGPGGKIWIFPPLPYLSHVSLFRPCSSRLVVSLMTFKCCCLLVRFYKVGCSKSKMSVENSSK